MLTKEILQSLCGDQDRASVARPFSVQLDGVWHNGATNGSAIVLEIGPADYRRDKTPPVENLFRKSKPQWSANVDALKAWFCVGPDTNPCDWCAGSGTHTCDCKACEIVAGDSCPGCDGDGSFPRREAVTFAGVTFDRVLVGRYLRHISGQRVMVEFGNEGEPLRLDGDGWKILVMPMRAAAHEKSGAIPAELFEKL